MQAEYYASQTRTCVYGNRQGRRPTSEIQYFLQRMLMRMRVGHLIEQTGWMYRLDDLSLNRDSSRNSTSILYIASSTSVY